MSDTLAFDPRYALPSMVSGVEAADFQLDSFPRVDDAEPLPDPTFDFTPPPPGPAPDPFEEFQVDRKKISDLSLTPSLDGLFKPFDLDSDQPAAEFENLADTAAPRLFDYEDMDTRDQNVVRTLAQAEARSRELIQKARAEGFALTEAARTEAQGLLVEARARAGVEADVYAEGLRREAEIVASEAESRRGEAEGLRIDAEKERAAAETSRLEAEARRAEAEASLAAVKDRVAGLDRERREMEEAIENRRRELEAEYQGLQAELTARREEVLAEARTAGQREGYEQGLVEGRAAGHAEASGPWREKTALLADILGSLENLYQDLWRANGPMMIQLAIEAVEGILYKELKSSEDLAIRAFEASIDFLGQAHRVVFQVRPQDIPLLEEARAEQRHRLGALVKVSFQPDESLGPGDLIMESDVGRLDATVKHRSAQVLEALREAFESAEPYAGPAAVAEAEAEPELAESNPAEPDAIEGEPSPAGAP